MTEPQILGGFVLHSGLLDGNQQQAMVADLRHIAAEAPFYAPITPGGKAMTVRMTSAGRLGWVTDRRGYRYAPRHPDGQAWPEIPQSVLNVWQQVAGTPRTPDCCLINYYSEDARMGLHQDRDEGDFSFPVVSISLGDEALFRMGGAERGDKTSSVWLRSGDVMVMGGQARLAWHGVDRIRYGSSALLPKGGRINLTLRVVAA